MRRFASGLLLVLWACAEPPGPLPVEDAPPPWPDAVSDGSDPDVRPPPTTSPYPAADFTVELPYRGPEQGIDLAATASPARVDVHLLIDTTGSFGGEIAELQSALLTTLIPGLRARVPSLTLGVSSFEDVPIAPFGAPTDTLFRVLAQQTSDAVYVSGAVQLLDRPLGNGGDRPEDWSEALYQVATGVGLRTNALELVPPFHPRAGLADSGTLGGVGFREQSSRVVVLVTDAPTHEPADYGSVVPGAHSTAQAVAALQGLDARVVGVVSAPDARSGIESVATATGATVPPVGGGCTTGINGSTRAAVGGVCPLVYDLEPDGTGLSRTIVDGITKLLDAVVYDEVHGEAEDDTRGFVAAIEAVSAQPPAGAPAPGRVDALPAGMPDGTADTFTNVRANTALAFRVHLRNERVASLQWPQVFFLHVRVAGDGQTLRELVVRVIVPEGPKFDGGVGEGGTDAAMSEGAPDAAMGDAAVMDGETQDAAADGGAQGAAAD